MTARELVELLSKFDPNAKVLISAGFGWDDILDVEGINEDRPLVALDGSEINEPFISINRG